MAIVSLNSLVEGVIGKSLLSVPMTAIAREARASVQEAASTFALAKRPSPTAVPSPTPSPGLSGTMGRERGSALEGRESPTPEEAVATPTSTALPTATATGTPTLRPTPTPEPRLPISGLRIASIGLETKVVPARFVEGQGGGTWEVPAFAAGHAEFTAGAGAVGNAVLLGHVDSLRSGDVFRDLARVSMGDTLEVWSGNRRFDYRVVAIWSVPRTDGSVMQPTPKVSLSVITCTGQWLPLERDFSHRLVVRAELVRRY